MAKRSPNGAEMGAEIHQKLEKGAEGEPKVAKKTSQKACRKKEPEKGAKKPEKGGQSDPAGAGWGLPAFWLRTLDFSYIFGGNLG